MNSIDALVQGAVGSVFTAASVEIRRKGDVIYRRAFGTLDPEGGDGQTPTRDTLFDYASLTKLFTATAFFRLCDAGHVTIDTPVSAVLPEFSGVRPIQGYEHPLNTGETVQVVAPTDDSYDAGSVTFAQLLSHSSGLPAWINLRRYESIRDRQRACLESTFAYPPGSQVVYSDVGFILLGMAIETLTDSPLNSAMNRLVARPLGLSIQYSPIADPVGNVAPTEWDLWRGRRIIGDVHDENAATLDGKAGHAGLFGTATDCGTLAQLYLSKGGGFISQRLAKQAVTRQIEDRGLGWMLRSESGSSSGQYFSPDSFGHTGFVGNSLWVDPTRELICVLLTNSVFYGRNFAKEFNPDNPQNIVTFRKQFHDTVIETLHLQ